jgi:hypothetical protein
MFFIVSYCIKNYLQHAKIIKKVYCKQQFKQKTKEIPSFFNFSRAASAFFCSQTTHFLLSKEKFLPLYLSFAAQKYYLCAGNESHNSITQ